jgi:Skp family chaperone for outer membrane proteins
MNRVVFHQLTPATRYPAHSRSWNLLDHAGKWLGIDLAAIWPTRRVRVPNLLLALGLVATLGITAATSAAVLDQPARPASIISVLPVSAPAVSVPEAKTFPTLGQPAASAADSTAYAQIATLDDQLQSMNADLQGLQREGDELRDASQTQQSDLASARTNLAGSQESLVGQSQDLNARRSAIEQDLQSRLTTLNQSLTTANQAVGQVRSILGLPTVGSSVGGQ